ncbi:MAG: 30S ribosomal protein S20 [Alphaproteobacteria bacterium]|nr:30S ribosomal protein S20 [Alphaproteobacteria bacterium]
MPSHPSAEKRVRITAKRTAVNKNRRSQLRSAVRKAEEALAAGDKKAATVAFKAGEKAIMKGVSKGVIHRNTGSRKVSRLARRLKALSN